MWVDQGRWCLAHDGATSTNGHQLLNVLGQNAFTETVPLETVNASHRKKSKEHLASILKAQILLVKHVSGIITDGASNCVTAQENLKADPEIPNSISMLSCGEHCANRLVADLLAVAPWLIAVTKVVHKGCRFVNRKKRAQQAVRRAQSHAKESKVMQHTLKL